MFDWKAKRKQLRLQNYDYSQNGAYFVTICINNRLNLLGNIVGATLCGRPHFPDKMILKWLFELENKFDNICIDKYTVMPNHIHFILFIQGDHTGSPLPQIIDWYKTMTTNEYIKGVKAGLFTPFNKRLWQRSYFEHVIRNEREYIDIATYIENNPRKWELDKYCT